MLIIKSFLEDASIFLFIGYTLPFTSTSGPKMCGIYLSTNESAVYQALKLISNRGKDYCYVSRIHNITYAVSVLHIRDTVRQPLTKFPLVLYNGEIYNNDASDTNYINKIIVERYNDFLKNEHKENNDFCEVEIINEQLLEEEKDKNAKLPYKIQEKKNYKHEQKATNQFIPHNMPGATTKKGHDHNSKTEILKKTTLINSFYTQDLCKELNSESEMAIIISYENYIVFFKDYIGRRSLGFSLKKGFTVSSVNFDYEAIPEYLYIYDIQNKVLIRTKRKWRDLYFGLSDSVYTGDELRKSLYKSIYKRLHPYHYVVAFSGGVDSLLIVALLHHIIPKNKPIYLINTMFTHKKDSRDRKCGRLSHRELESLWPDRGFVFVENDVSYDILQKYKPHIERLMHPKTALMDFSISATLYFTAKKAVEYSRVLFLGCGADELFGGYKNHLNLKNLKERLLYDIKNIYERNCGRDDRVISDNNIEPRYPFLDLDVVNTGLNLKMEDYFDAKNEKVFNKAVLRRILKDFGFKNASTTDKVAMQFGSGITQYGKRSS